MAQLQVPTAHLVSDEFYISLGALHLLACQLIFRPPAAVH